MPSAWPTSVWPAAVRRDAAGVALEQHHPGLGLERCDLLGDGGLGVGERLGRGRERAAVGDLAQDPEPADVEHKLQLIAAITTIIGTDGRSVPS